MELKLQGDRELIAAMKRLQKLYPGAFGAALYQSGMDVWNAAAKKTPVDTGLLRSSAYVSPPQKRSADIAVEVGYGTKYAVYQHEKKNLKHTTGEAEYLRKAIDEVRGSMLSKLSERTASNVQRGIEAPAIGAPTRPKSGSLRAKRKHSARISKASRKLTARRKR